MSDKDLSNIICKRLALDVGFIALLYHEMLSELQSTLR
jgi:hypothetical protein